MLHVKFVGLGIAFLLVLIMILVQFQKRRQAREDLTGWKHDLKDSQDFDEVLGVRRVDATQEFTNAASQSQAHTLQTDSLRKQLSQNYFAMHIIPSNKEYFTGDQLLSALTAVGLKFGELGAFHKYRKENDELRAIFSVVNMCEPGSFSIEQIPNQTFNGITIFIEFTETASDEKYFYDFLHTAKLLSGQLNGAILNIENNQKIPDEQLQQMPKYLSIQSFDIIES